MRRYRTLVSLSLVMSLLAGCNYSLAAPSSGSPEAWIDAPLNGSSVPLAPVNIVWHAAAAGGVTQVLFGVNEAPEEAAAQSEPGGAFVMGTRTWVPAAPGEYVLHVRAQDKGGTWGPVATTSVIVLGAASAALTPTSTPAPTLAPRPGCADKLDVTFEDPLQKAQMLPGQKFTKTWTVQNAGSCTWGRGYHLVFAGGPSMSEGAASMDAPMDIPLALIVPIPVLPGQQVALSLAQTAPGTEGWYVGAWNLVAANGETIPITYGGGGTMPSLYVDIVVKGSNPTPTPVAAAGASVEVVRISTDVVAYEVSSRCAPTSVTIAARAIDPAGIRAVVLFFRLRNKESGETTDFYSRAMDPQGGDLYSTAVDPNAEIIRRVGFPGSGEAWLQYQAVIQDAAGNTSTRTPLLSDITVRGC